MNKLKITQYKGNLLMLSALILFSFVINLFIKNGVDFSYLGITMGDGNDFVTLNTTLVGYTVLKRIKQLAIIYMLMRLFRPELIYNLLIILFGIMSGAFITVQSYLEGILGAIYLVVSVLPHFIFYIFLVKFMYATMVEKDTRMTRARIYMVYVLIFTAGIVIELIFSKIFFELIYQYMG